MTPNEYFEEHTIDPAFAKEKFAVSWDDKKITIPVYNIKGRLEFNRYRHLEGTAKFTNDKGAHPILFAMYKAKKFDDIVLCEGEPDCIRLWQAGIPAVTGTAGVKTFSPKLAEPLKGKNVRIVLDNDEAGSSAIEKYFSVLTESGAVPTITTLPGQFKDVCEYFSAGYTKEDFEALPRLSLDDWYDQNEPEEFKFVEGSEILKRQLQPEEWLVDRILPVEGFAFIIGAEATAKSFYALTLAHSVSSGIPWLFATDKDGKTMFQVKEKQKVLIIDKENTKRRTQSRMKGLGITGKNIFWLEYPHFFELADPNEEDGISKIAKSAARKVKKEGIKFVVVDSFTDVMVGNENAAGDVQGFFDAMRRLFPGCSILVLHHASKPAAGVVRTSAQRARGSTNIMAQVYSAFFAEAVPKSKTEFTLEQTKAGDAEKLNKFKIALQVAPIPNQDGKTMVTALTYEGEVIDAEMKVEEAKEAIEEAFTATTTISRKELSDICVAKSVSLRSFERAIKEMKDEGLIESVKEGKFTNYVWVERGSVYEE